MAAYSFNYAGSKMTAQLNVTNLLDRTYYTSELQFCLPWPPARSGASVSLLWRALRGHGVAARRARQGVDASAWLLPVADGRAVAALLYLDGPLCRRPDGLRLGPQRRIGQLGHGSGPDRTSSNLIGSGAQGVIGGAHVGYNQQFDQWVLGLEGSVDGTTAEQKSLIVPGPNLIADPNPA